MTTIVWFRQDLRCADNPALSAAAAKGPVLPLFILDDETPGPWSIGGAQRWWLHHSLVALRRALGGLVLLQGDPREILPRLVRDARADAVFWNRSYEPWAVRRDTELKAALSEAGTRVESFNARLLNEPWEIKNGSGEPFKVFTPYWKAAQQRPVDDPLPAPEGVKLGGVRGIGDSIEELNLLPTRPNWAAGWEKLWKPGESGAGAALARFIATGLDGYGDMRDRPDLMHTSQLSPHLHFGEISPRQALAAVERAKQAPAKDKAKFASELGWREFAYHLLFHYPTLPEKNWRAQFDAYPWTVNANALRAWQKGQTGYPIVDAGMRQLWQTGWMHNRVRMITASFLVKHLRIDWRTGERWFWDTLLDADLANNASGWQWVAGSGADAAPYFRIFNPMTQGQKFDPEGRYVRQWCPELAKLPTEHIHAPFEAPPMVLAAAGVELGKTYPLPVVDHAKARAAALAGFESLKLAAQKSA